MLRDLLQGAFASAASVIDALQVKGVTPTDRVGTTCCTRVGKPRITTGI